MTNPLNTLTSFEFMKYNECIGDCVILNKWVLSPFYCGWIDFMFKLFILTGMVMLILWIFDNFWRKGNETNK